MSLTSGTRLGPYEVVAPLGSGGMGEVYRARDTRLGREGETDYLVMELIEGESLAQWPAKGALPRTRAPARRSTRCEPTARARSKASMGRAAAASSGW